MGTVASARCALPALTPCRSVAVAARQQQQCLVVVAVGGAVVVAASRRVQSTAVPPQAVNLKKGVGGGVPFRETVVCTTPSGTEKAEVLFPV